MEDWQFESVISPAGVALNYDCWTKTSKQ